MARTLVKASEIQIGDMVNGKKVISVSGNAFRTHLVFWDTSTMAINSRIVIAVNR